MVAALERSLCASEPRGALDLAGPESLPYRELLARCAARSGGGVPWIHPIPPRLARAAARLAEAWLSNPPVTEAMLDVLLQDDEVDARPAWNALGLEPHPLGETLDHWIGVDAT